MYFFTEHSELEPQTAAEAYGALSSIEYRISSLFKTTIPTKAFACQEGQIIVQQSQLSADLVNVVLQPTDELQHHIKPQYYIYRGIRKDSLISGTNIIQPASGTSEFIDRYFSQNPTEFGAELLGYNDASDGIVRLEELFALPEPNSYTTKVIAGEWFGMFGNEYAQDAYRVEFEIILDSRLFKFNLNYLRSEHYTISVAGLSAGLELRTRREAILAFIDLAAFFGSLYDAGVTLISYINDEKTEETLKKQALYNRVLKDVFATQNTVYLDIRSEKGFSYNFYGNYADSVTGNNFDLIFGSNAQVNTYASNGWPIISINSNQGNESVNKITFRLRIDDNRLPILYLTDPKVLNPERNNTNRFLTKADIFDYVTNPSIDWSRPITFKFRNSSASSSNKPNIANYIRIYYFRQECDYDEHNSALDYNHYYNGAFCPIDFDGNTFRSVHPVYVREKMNADGTGNFGFTAETGVYRDEYRTVFYSNYNGNGKPVFSGKKYLPTYEKNLELSNADFQSSLHPRIHTIVRDYPINASTSRRVIGINAFFDGNVLKEKEDALMLGLTNIEIDAIRAAAGLSDIHERYIYLMPAAGNPLVDTDNKRYHSFTLQLQGLNDAGIRTIITPQVNGNNVILYSRDKVFFSSDAFGQMEDVTTGENRIEFHIYHNNCIKTNDNIDLSLLSSEGLLYNQVILNSTQEIIQSLYFIYIDVNNIRQNVCHLSAVQINKVERGERRTDLLRSATPPVDVQTFLHDAALGVDAYLTWIYANGDIVTFGKSARGHANNYSKIYSNSGKKTFLVMFSDTQILNSNLFNFNFIDSQSDATRRYYFDQTQAAAVLGGLIKFHNNYNNILNSGGASFPTGGCFPSNTHNSGLAWDLSYINLVTGNSYPNATYAADKRIIDEMENYGFGNNNETYVGENSTFNFLVQNTIAVTYPRHNDHIHFGGFILNNNCDNE